MLKKTHIILEQNVDSGRYEKKEMACWYSIIEIVTARNVL